MLIVSTELDEVLALGDRIAVMFEGRIVGVLDAKEATRERVGLFDLSHLGKVDVDGAEAGADVLIGGLYGVAIGAWFGGESMFSAERDASKVALVHLVGLLRARGFPLVDCQMSTSHLATLGAREVPRADFVREVSRLAALEGRPGRWTLEAAYPAAAAGDPAS